MSAAEPDARGRAGLRRALAANMLATVWSGAVAILAVPLYIRYLGVEAYGLIGLFTTLQLSLALLDLGLSSTTTREMARRSGSAGGPDDRPHLLRTLEYIYAAVAVLIVVGLLAAAGPLARHWVNPEHLDTKTVEHAFRHMAFAIAAQWPASLYVGALLGLERQVAISVMGTIFSTTKALGIITVFWIFHPTVEAFFLWQTVNAVVQVVILAALAWRAFPGAFLRSRFRPGLLREVWRFAAGTMAIDATGIVLSQVDKVILSKFLTLEAFGMFALVSTVASNLSRIVGPVFTVYYPRLATLVAKGDRHEISRTYHDGAQVLATLVAPVCVVLAIFPRELLVVWTGNHVVADASGVVLSVLIVGRLVNAVMHLPAALQLANGWTRMAVINNVVSILVVVPLMFVGARRYGALGAAFGWVLLNVGGLLYQVPVMHRQLLPGEMGRWARDGVLLPTASAAAVGLVARGLVGGEAARWWLLLELAVVTTCCFVGCVAATPAPRRWLRGRLQGGGAGARP